MTIAAATLTKTVLLAILAACGRGDPPVSPGEKPDDHNELKVKDNVYFCCVDVDLKAKTGEGCVTIGEKQVDSCDKALICANGAGKDGTTVVCF